MVGDNPKKPTRQDLAQFLPNSRLVRAFEQLFEMIPSSVDELDVSVGTADAKATLALASLERIADALELLAQAPVTQEDSPEDDLQPRAFEELDFEDLHPPIVLGTLAAQNDDSVEITGGSVTAELTDSSTDLLKSSATLSDGTGAGIGTLTNAPSAGDPTKWVAIDDNGTTRYIPTWT